MHIGHRPGLEVQVDEACLMHGSRSNRSAIEVLSGCHHWRESTVACTHGSAARAPASVRPSPVIADAPLLRVRAARVGSTAARCVRHAATVAEGSPRQWNREYHGM